MNKKILLFLLLLPLKVSADNSHKLIVKFKNGDIIGFVLKDKPEITFNTNDFIVKTANLTTEYVRSDIADFHFEESTSVIESIEYVGSDDVTIYDMSGHKKATLEGDSQEAVIQTIDSYKPGMYIIKIGNQRTIKYLKK